MASDPAQFDAVVCVVGFHHARGPEIESWIGTDHAAAYEAEWPLLPFLALADGAHSSVEEFSYFTLRKEATETGPTTSLFGISCTRQLDSASLIDRPADVTRSTVQKAVVVICDRPQNLSQLREKLSVVTKAWFAQKDFRDVSILNDFQDSLGRSFKDVEDEKDQFFGLSLRDMIHEFKYQTLVLFKCLLLQPKMLFFGTNCERLCMMQFSLISLIPGLMRKLQDCADPQLNSLEEKMVMPTSLKTSERSSLLAYVGLPLHIFGKGSVFGPYTPLQQLDMLSDHDTKSFVVGSTNSLLLSQKDKYCDILINLDENAVVIGSPALRQVLSLSVADRRWIDFLTQTVNDTWDEENPGRPKTLGYAGSEEFIRLQFEEYLLALLSAVKYHIYITTKKDDAKHSILDIEGDPTTDFGPEWVNAWMDTENFRLFNKFTDSHIFDIVDPKHPCSGGLTIEDVQRRLAQQVADLNLDERIQNSREVIGKHLATGQQKVSTAFNDLWAGIEAMREAQRLKAAEQQANEAIKGPVAKKTTADGEAAARKFQAPDLTQAQATVQAAGQRAGAYLSSWGAWASEKRKTGWPRSSSPSGSVTGSRLSQPPKPPTSAPISAPILGPETSTSSLPPSNITSKPESKVETVTKVDEKAATETPTSSG